MTLKKQRVGKVFKVYAITCRCALIRTIFLIVIALMLTLLWQEKNRLSKPISHRNFNDIAHLPSGKMLLKRGRKRDFHRGLPGHRFTLWRGVWGKRKPGQWYPVASPPFTWEPGMVVTADTLHKTQNVGPVAFHEAQFNFRTHNNHIWLAAVEVSDA